MDTLLERVAALEAQVDRLERLLYGAEHAAHTLTIELGLSPTHARILGLLVRRRLVLHDAIWDELYGNRIKVPNDNIVRVHIRDLRRLAARHGIEIVTSHGSKGERGGYLLTDSSRTLLRAIIAGSPIKAPVMLPVVEAAE